MSDIERIVSSAETHGAGAGAAVVGAYIAKKLFGPSFEVVGARLAEVTEKRLENLGKIGEKFERWSSRGDEYPHVRVVQRVLNHATLYDDDLQQTYVAGILAGSRNSDGSNDRPVFYLSVIDGLTASQLRAFHVLYAAVAREYRGITSNRGPTMQSISVSIGDYLSNLSSLSPLTGSLEHEVTVDILALEHLGLIRDASIDYNSESDGEISFWATRIGAMLFDWAHGIDDDDRNFGLRERPDIGLPQIVWTE